jgi:hypothetical protein
LHLNIIAMNLKGSEAISSLNNLPSNNYSFSKFLYSVYLFATKAQRHKVKQRYHLSVTSTISGRQKKRIGGITVPTPELI